jgi:uncharacterized glyoxalase superfamily protein PhnB
MLSKNRSIPACVVIPELAYANVAEAAAWLCDRFGLVERLRMGNHRVQLLFGDGAVVVMQRNPPAAPQPGSPAGVGQTHALMVRVGGIDRHYATAIERGVRILRPLAEYPYGEKQYTAEDIGGHVWTFSETIADIDPASWGGVLVADAAKKGKS